MVDTTQNKVISMGNPSSRIISMLTGTIIKSILLRDYCQRCMLSDTTKWLLIMSNMVVMTSAEICRKMMPSKKFEVFECPRIFESKIKSWCCGFNTLQTKCCDWSERVKEVTVLRYSLDGLAIRLLFSLLVAIILLCLFYYLFIQVRCCFQKHSPRSNSRSRNPLYENPLHPTNNMLQMNPAESDRMLSTDQPPSYVEAMAQQATGVHQTTMSNSSCSSSLSAVTVSPFSPGDSPGQELTTYSAQLPYNPQFNAT